MCDGTFSGLDGAIEALRRHVGALRQVSRSSAVGVVELYLARPEFGVITSQDASVGELPYRRRSP